MDSPNLPTILGANFILFLAFFIILLIILWTLLPFAVFGIKKRLDLTLNELRIMNATLNSLRLNPVKPQDVSGTTTAANFLLSDRDQCAKEILDGFRSGYLPTYIRSKLKKDHNYSDSLIIEVANQLQREGKLSREKAEAICASDK